jgi:hypothetical protein
MRARLLAVLLLASPLPAAAGLLTAQGVSVLDATGAPRATFSTSETIGFQVVVHNGAASPNRTSFEFDVVAPDGAVVFRHVGNSVRGTVGSAASTVSGIPISGFSRGPGTYTLKALATLDGVAVEQDKTFEISSPNIVLIYPPDGSRDLTDNPLTFRWYSSGAVTYRLTVGVNPSLYNAVFAQTTPPGAESLTYPQAPSNPLESLSTGQTYWWSVEGLDVDGNVVARSQIPFSFSVANTALTRDLAVTDLSVDGTPDASGNIPFRIVVADQGNTTESNVPLRVTVGGLTAPGTPLTVPQLSPSGSMTFRVSAPIPTDMNQGLAIACLTIFDDDVANNCMTLSVSRPPAISTTTFASQTTQMSADQVWQAIEQILKDQGVDLSGYDLVDMEGSLSQADLQALIDQLDQGQAQVDVSGPPLPLPAAPETSSAPPAGLSSSAPPPPAAPEAGETESVPPEMTWTGSATPLSAKVFATSITSAARWESFWKRLSPDPVPDVDFSQHLVLLIMAGRADRADRVEIKDATRSGKVLTVRYRLVSYARPFAAGWRARAVRTKPEPYVLEAVPRMVLKVKFKRLTEKRDD